MGTVHRLASHTEHLTSSSSQNEGFCCCSRWPLRFCQGSVPLLWISWICWIRWPSTCCTSSCCSSNRGHLCCLCSHHCRSSTTSISAKHEQGNAYVGVSGSYSYVDANGKLQTTNYIADGLGFRVQATNLPVAPVFEGKAPVFEGKAPVFDLVGPAPVEDTAEVKAAKLEFQAKFDEAAAREKRSTPAATEAIEPLKLVAPAPVAVAAPFAYAGAYAPYTYGYGAGAFAPYNYGLAPYTFPAATPVDYSVIPAINIPVAPLPEEKAEE